MEKTAEIQEPDWGSGFSAEAVFELWHIICRIFDAGACLLRESQYRS